MSGLFAKAARWAQSSQGKKAVKQAKDYAGSEKGRRQIESLQRRFGAGRFGGGRKPR